MLEKIQADLKAAMIARDEQKKLVLSGLKSAIRMAEIDSKQTLDDAAALKVLQKEAKKRKESIKLYEEAGDADRAAAEKAELAIIEAYLPAQATEADITAAVEAAITETAASSMQDMGKVMGIVTAKFGGTADGATVAKIVREKLA
jgi:uncharacterized protein YqeY